VAAWLWLRGGCQGEASAEACGPATNGRWPVTASRAASGALVEETIGGTLLCSSRPWDHTPHDAEVRVGIVWWDKEFDRWTEDVPHLAGRSVYEAVKSDAVRTSGRGRAGVS